jgi:hypothetical protein
MMTEVTAALAHLLGGHSRTLAQRTADPLEGAILDSSPELTDVEQVRRFIAVGLAAAAALVGG